MCNCGIAYRPPVVQDEESTLSTFSVQSSPVDCGYTESELDALLETLETIKERECPLLPLFRLNSYLGIVRSVKNGICINEISEVLDWLEANSDNVADCIPTTA